jgi:hypothetical protein
MPERPGRRRGMHMTHDWSWTEPTIARCNHDRLLPTAADLGVAQGGAAGCGTSDVSLMLSAQPFVTQLYHRCARRSLEQLTSAACDAGEARKSPRSSGMSDRWQGRLTTGDHSRQELYQARDKTPQPR